MRLCCPHCERDGDHARSDFFGDWVICPQCELPFAWREARMRGDRADLRGNGKHATPNHLNSRGEKQR